MKQTASLMFAAMLLGPLASQDAAELIKKGVTGIAEYNCF
jgi:hypothetical protein